MQILIQYPFTEEQTAHLCQIARDQGHEPLVATDESEAVSLAGAAEVIISDGRTDHPVLAALAGKGTTIR